MKNPIKLRVWKGTATGQNRSAGYVIKQFARLNTKFLVFSVFLLFQESYISSKNSSQYPQIKMNTK